ncbi:MAG: methyltransferase domain-containing protein [Crenarchaeota archaeon]|nr:methyltransferase domain-containing protein [Thermoproteota archaeon]
MLWEVPFPELNFSVPYVPTPRHVAREMLKLAEVGPGDVVYDLGSGDGRIPIMAVEEFGASRGVGVEIRSDLCQIAWEEVKKRGLEDKVEIVNADALDVPLGEATVVTMFLLPDLMELLRPKLERELRPGARVVSHEYVMAGWRPVKVVRIEDEHMYHTLILYEAGKSF